MHAYKDLKALIQSTCRGFILVHWFCQIIFVFYLIFKVGNNQCTDYKVGTYYFECYFATMSVITIIIIKPLFSP